MASPKYTLRRVGATATPAQGIALANALRPFFVGPPGAWPVNVAGELTELVGTDVIHVIRGASTYSVTVATLQGAFGGAVDDILPNTLTLDGDPLTLDGDDLILE